MPFQLKRIYDPASPDDGKRVLVDRLWPRGVSKERAALFEWQKDIAPSPALREWFCHKPELFDAFTAKYREELTRDPEKKVAVAALQDLSKEGMVTLLYAAKSPEINQAVVLKRYLEEFPN